MEGSVLSRLNKSYIFFNKGGLTLIDEIMEELFREDRLHLQKVDGSFKISTQSEISGPFQTAEALLPLLLVPNKTKYIKQILSSLNYLIKKVNASKDDGVIPAPEIVGWQGSAVDSSAYTLYVFAVAMDYLEHAAMSTDVKKETINKIENATIELINYIDGQKNPDGGWGFINGLKSRIYTTSLVVSALSCVLGKDLGNARKKVNANYLGLIHSGVKFIIDMECKGNCNSCRHPCSYKDERNNVGGWYFSEDQDDENHLLDYLQKEGDCRRERKEIHPNITAVAIFSLANSLKHFYGEEIENDIKDALKKGSKFLENNCDFKTLILRDNALRKYDNIFGKMLDVDKKIIHKLKSLENIGESLKIPSVTIRKKGSVDYRDVEYAQPYHMLLPALLISGFFGFNHEDLTFFKDRIINEYRKTIEMHREKHAEVKLWEVTDTIFALSAYYSVADVINNSYNIYSNANELISYLRNQTAQLQAQIIQIKQNKTTALRKLKNKWRELPSWEKALLVQCVETFCTLPILLSLDLNQISLGLPFSTIWSIYAIKQALVLAGLQGYFYQKDKSRGDTNEQRK